MFCLMRKKNTWKRKPFLFGSRMKIQIFWAMTGCIIFCTIRGLYIYLFFDRSALNWLSDKRIRRKDDKIFINTMKSYSIYSITFQDIWVKLFRLREFHYFPEKKNHRLWENHMNNHCTPRVNKSRLFIYLIIKSMIWVKENTGFIQVLLIL